MAGRRPCMAAAWPGAGPRGGPATRRRGYGGTGWESGRTSITDDGAELARPDAARPALREPLALLVEGIKPRVDVDDAGEAEAHHEARDLELDAARRSHEGERRIGLEDPLRLDHHGVAPANAGIQIDLDVDGDLEAALDLPPL